MISTTAAGSGHPTSCMSAAELMAGNIFHASSIPRMQIQIMTTASSCRKGHAAPVLYSALAEAGVFPVSRVMTLREFSSELEGHPTPRIHGVDAATGLSARGFPSVPASQSVRAWIRATRAFTSCSAMEKWPKGKSGKRLSSPATTSSTT